VWLVERLPRLLAARGWSVSLTQSAQEGVGQLVVNIRAQLAACAKNRHQLITKLIMSGFHH
jgi:hypothetical protein